MYKRKRRGPGIDPWGTPHLTGRLDDTLESKSTYWDLLVRLNFNPFINLLAVPLIPSSFVLYPPPPLYYPPTQYLYVCRVYMCNFIYHIENLLLSLLDFCIIKS